MVEFFGTKITEQELEAIQQDCVLGLGRCQVMLEFASTIEDRLFAGAACDAFMSMLKECFRVLP